MSEMHETTALLVEDEDGLRKLLAVHLRSAGFRVIEAEEGGRAIELAGREGPDLIIMDIGLPGMDGIAATRAIKADPACQDIPIIMLTARSRSEDVVRGLEAGAQEYLAKPFDMAELMARVQTVRRLAAARKQLDYLNSQLEAEVGVKTLRLQVLYDFMRELNGAQTKERVADLVVRSVERMTGARRISLFLTDTNSEHLVCERAVGLDPKVVDAMRVEAVNGITGQVFRTATAIAARAYGRRNDARSYDGDVFLSTPLLTSDSDTEASVRGVLNVTERDKDEPFLDEEIEGIRSIADAAAIALENIVRQQRLQESVKVLLRTVGHLSEYRDEETRHHLGRVTEMSRTLAHAMQGNSPYSAQVTSEFVESLVHAAPMHDIGKVGISDEILTKPGKLTAAEFETMKTHTDIGRRVLSEALDHRHPVPLLQMCVDIAYCHHERWDGGGYPQGLSGEEIPLAARIISLVDAYDAITSKRRYKDARSHEEAMEIIREDSGRHFDPTVVDAFFGCHEAFDEIRARHADEMEPALV